VLTCSQYRPSTIRQIQDRSGPNTASVQKPEYSRHSSQQLERGRRDTGIRRSRQAFTGAHCGGTLEVQRVGPEVEGWSSRRVSCHAGVSLSTSTCRERRHKEYLDKQSEPCGSNEENNLPVRAIATGQPFPALPHILIHRSVSFCSTSIPSSINFGIGSLACALRWSPQH
jgi:hypothetical protein